MKIIRKDLIYIKPKKNLDVFNQNIFDFNFINFKDIIIYFNLLTNSILINNQQQYKLHNVLNLKNIPQNARIENQTSNLFNISHIFNLFIFIFCLIKFLNL